MSIDTGTAVIIVAVLIFYLRLIIVQRERTKQLHRQGQAKGRSKKNVQPVPLSILSPNRRDWVIAGVGALAIVVGVLVYIGWVPVLAVQPYWWLAVALGIVAFSWAFR